MQREGKRWLRNPTSAFWKAISTTAMPLQRTRTLPQRFQCNNTHQLRKYRRKGQGKALVDAAAANGSSISSSLQLIVVPEAIPILLQYRISGRSTKIEQHLKEVAAKPGRMDWAIIRPVTFMEDFES